MGTLEAQRNRLRSEMSLLSEKMERARKSAYPDVGQLKQLTEEMERAKQLMYMIDDHLNCGHQPTWRTKT